MELDADPDMPDAPTGKRKSNKPGEKSQFWQNTWPEAGPFTIGKRTHGSQYHLVGHVTVENYDKMREDDPEGTFPWTEYLARRFGPGYYAINHKGGRSAFVVPQTMLPLFQIGPPASETRANPPAPFADPLEVLETNMARMERLKELLGANEPPPPPGPSAVDKLLAMLPALMQQLAATRPASSPSPSSAPSAWDQIGRLYESRGVSPEMVLAEFEARLTEPPPEPTPPSDATE